jgi:hypothetical protein
MPSRAHTEALGDDMCALTRMHTPRHPHTDTHTKKSSTGWFTRSAELGALLEHFQAVLRQTSHGTHITCRDSCVCVCARARVHVRLHMCKNARSHT